MNPDWRTRYELAIDAARQGRRARPRVLLRRDLARRVEGGPEPRHHRRPEAEKLLRDDAARQRFPNDGFLGEEFGDTPGNSGFRWIIDPIDGTRSFVRGMPLWATLVGLEYQAAN